MASVRGYTKGGMSVSPTTATGTRLPLRRAATVSRPAGGAATAPVVARSFRPGTTVS
eukprot:m.1108027 g.1108027  ORF g.1108027 m.1108027 type:complete len:57 (+) comp24351_c0_seq3:2134-2304(+)